MWKAVISTGSCARRGTAGYGWSVGISPAVRKTSSSPRPPALCRGAPQGLANKTFEYVSAGLSIVSSLAGENGDLLEQTGAGVMYPAGDAEACYAPILGVLNSPERARQISEVARKTYAERFSSTAVFGSLATALANAAEASKLPR